METVFLFITAFLQKIQDGLSILWIWAVLPIIFLVYGAIGAAVMWFQNDVTMAKDMRDFRRKSKSAFLSQMLHRYTKWTLIATLVLFLVPAFLYLNLSHDSLVYALIDNTGTLCSMVIGLTTIVLTVSVVIVIFNQNYYLVFTITDVLKSYHFTTCLGVVLLSCLFTCVCCLTVLWVDIGVIWCKLVLLILEACILCNLTASAGSFWIIYEIMFSGRKVELRQLKRLYRIFRGYELSEESIEGDAQDWSWTAVRTNVEYLCASYLTAARKVPIHNVTRLRYLVGENREKTFDDWYLVLKVGYIGGTFLAWAASMTVILVGLRADGIELALLNTGLFLLCCLPLLFLNKKLKETMHNLFVDSLGYCLELGHRRPVPILRYSFGPSNRYDRFIQGMNSLTAFFCIAMQRGAKRELIEQALDVVLDWFSDVRERHDSLYLPVFAIGYFAFERDLRLPAVKRCYDQLRSGPILEIEDRQTGARPGAGDKNQERGGSDEERADSEGRSDQTAHPVEHSASREDAGGAGKAAKWTDLLGKIRPPHIGPDTEESFEEYIINFYSTVEDILPGSRDLMQRILSPRVGRSESDDFDAMLAGHLLDLTQDTVGQGEHVVRSIAEYINWLHGIDRTAV